MDSIFMALAAAEAEKFNGATTPNPPVGACLIKDGRVLGVRAHMRAGLDHAEVSVLKSAVLEHGSAAVRGASLYVTLEPCNHQGRTPPCTGAILESGVARVVYAANDPNKNVQGGGAAMLKAAGLAVEQLTGQEASQRLIEGFKKRVQTGRPWVVHKLAYRFADDGRLTMIPRAGAKTFTSPESLKLAHLERRKCDAVLTGMGTVLADAPLFNVRAVEDHPGKRRLLAVLSQAGRTLPGTWLTRQNELGFDVVCFRTLTEALDDLGRRGALRVLVEAGPLLSAALTAEKLWDERITFMHHSATNHTDSAREYACSREL